MKILNWEQLRYEIKIIIFSFVSWFLAGYDLILLSLFNNQIGLSFFPSIDPTNTMLAIYGILSLSLLSRMMGGILFGYLGDKYGRKIVLQWCTFLLGIIMFVSAFIPDVYHPINEDLIILNPLLFALTRISIGFLVGGIWPTGGVLAIENIYNKEKGHGYGSDKEFEDITKKYSFKSSILQSGFHVGYLASYLLFLTLIVALPDYGKSCSNFICNLFQYFSLVFEPWKIMSLIGGIAGIIWGLVCCKSMPESIPWLSWKETKNSERQSIVKFIENKENNSKLVNFWLILTGLMYMYYSTIVILPEVLLRNNVTLDIFNIHYSSLILIFLIVTLIAHLWPGILGKYLWDRKKNSIVLEKFYDRSSKFMDKILQRKRKTLNLAQIRAVESNKDIILIIIIGFLILFIGIIGLLIFWFIFILAEDILSFYNIVIIYSSIVMLIANSGFALVLPLLTSRFKITNRNIAASIVYNGSLVIGFASPFIAMQSFLTMGLEQLMFVPMIIGAFAMIIGAKRYIQSYPTKILLLDEEAKTSCTIKNMLEDNGFKVYSFNPISELDKYEVDFYDLVILDITTLKKDEFQLYTKIREKDPKVKICFLTSSTMIYKNFTKTYSEFNIIIDKEQLIKKLVSMMET